MQNGLNFESRQLSNINFNGNFLSCLFDASRITDFHYSSLALQYLHPNELLILKHRKNIIAQKEYFASRFIIKNIIAKWHDCSFEVLHVCFDKVKNRLVAFKGSKYLPYRISLSHSKGQVLVVVTRDNNELGVDLEYIDTKRQTRKLAESFFHSKEQALVALNDVTAFYKLWTIKEAVAKMRGQSVMTILGEDITALPSGVYTISGIYHDFAIALVSSEPINNITVNIVEVALLVKGSHE